MDATVTAIGSTAAAGAHPLAGCAEELLEGLRGARIIARGPKAQAAVHGAGLTADWVADSETAAEIKELFESEGVAGVLWLRRSAASLGGRALPLSQVQFAVLRSLVEAKGGVVSREEILAVLPGSSNDPHAAEVAVARLRDSMGDRSLVRTVPRRGYRLEVSA